MTETKIKPAFKELKRRLVALEQDPLQRRSFLYLDIISWLDSKILEISMEQAIKRRREAIV